MEEEALFFSTMELKTANNIGSLSVIEGFAIVVFGLVSMLMVNLTALCVAAMNGADCANDYTPFFAPAFIGGALMFAGSLILWTIKPFARTPC